MKARIVYIERKFWKKNFAAFSIEKIYEQISKLLPADKFETATVKVPFGNSFFDILRNLVFFKRPAADLYHVTGHIHYLSLILPRNKTVLTIHDLGFLQNPGKLRRFVIRKLFLDLPVKKLDYITAVSETTRDAIIAATNCSPEKVVVIENPVQEHYLTGRKKEFDKACPVILQVGITPNKNIPNLIKALDGIDCRLRIIGNLTPDLIAHLEAGKIIYENAFGLDDLEMKREYEQADIVAFCSTFEGFGMPIIEAQAMRTAVITSAINPMKDVAGQGAAFADPNDVSSIREGILKLIDDDEYRERLIEKGSKNALRFEARSIAGLYEKLYQEVLEKSGRQRS
ncbi:MAG: glycosyltransferase family 1 protein [Acidobacteriota bacterium]